MLGRSWRSWLFNLLLPTALVLVVGVGPALPAVPITGQTSLAQVPKDQYIIVLKRDVSDVAGTAGRLARDNGFAVEQTYSVAIRGFTARLSERAAARIAAHPQVAYVVRDQPVTLTQ